MLISINLSQYRILCNEWPKGKEGKKVELITITFAYLCCSNFKLEGVYNKDQDQIFYSVNFQFIKKEASVIKSLITVKNNDLLKLSINCKKSIDGPIFKSLLIDDQKKTLTIINYLENQEQTEELLPFDNIFSVFCKSAYILVTSNPTALRHKLIMMSVKKYANFESYVDNKLTLSDKKNPNMKIIIECDIPTDISLNDTDYEQLLITQISICIPGFQAITVNIADLVLDSIE